MCSPISSRTRLEIPPRGALNDKEFRALRGATADRGGSDKPLKRLERNFQNASRCRREVPDKSKFEMWIELFLSF